MLIMQLMNLLIFLHIRKGIDTNENEKITAPAGRPVAD